MGDCSQENRELIRALHTCREGRSLVCPSGGNGPENRRNRVVFLSYRTYWSRGALMRYFPAHRISRAIVPRTGPPVSSCRNRWAAECGRTNVARLVAVGLDKRRARVGHGVAGCMARWEDKAAAGAISPALACQTLRQNLYP